MTSLKGPAGPIAINICGCGSNHNAIDTAFAILKQHLKPVEGEMCATYAAGVAEALQIMISQMVRAAVRTHAIAEGKDDPRIVDDSATYALSKVAIEVTAGFYNNHASNEALASFLCDECGAAESDRKLFSGGPDYITLLKAGYMPPPEERAAISRAILDGLLGRRPN